MMHLISQIQHIIQQHSYETDDDRIDRLTTLGDDLGANPESLHHFEEGLKSLTDTAQHASDRDPDNGLADLAEVAAESALGMDVEGEQALSMLGIDWATVRPLLVQTGTANAAALAPVVKLLHDLYRGVGLYQDLGINPEQNIYFDGDHANLLVDATSRARTPPIVDDLESQLGDDLDALAEDTYSTAGGTNEN